MNALRALLLWLLSWPAPRRTSWMRCDCGHDLNGDDASWVGTDAAGLEHYACARCGERSTWDLDAPVPLRLRAGPPRRD